MWHGFWANKLLTLRRAGVLVYSRPIRYREHEVELDDGTTQRVVTPQEKGIDIRLALDVMRLALSKQFDIAAIFSQDQDLSELVEDIKEVSRTQDRWLQLASVFPIGPQATAHRGIDKTEWVHMDQTFYDACLDPYDYRPARFRPSGSGVS